MQIEPHASVSSLRLVQPPMAVRAIEQAAPISSVASTARAGGDGESFKFDAIYQASLPKAAVGKALERLDRIRAQLIAARTAVPIHFDTTQPAAALRSSTLARAYLRTGPSPADLNVSATEAAAIRLDETA